MFCILLFVLLSIFFCPLCCLYFLDLRILITPVVSSNSSYTEISAYIVLWAPRGRDQMVVGFTATCSTNAYHL